MRNTRAQEMAGSLADQRGVTVGKMFGSSGPRFNGKVFAMLVKGNLAAKRPRESQGDVDLVRQGIGLRSGPRPRHEGIGSASA
jgi:hypothetical protein